MSDPTALPLVGTTPFPFSVRASRVNPDRDLIARCRAGNPEAERALYDAHVERVYRLVYRMAGDGDLAEDFTQETFIRAFERLSQYRGEASLATWLHSIAVSVTLNGMRRVKRMRLTTTDISELPLLASESRELPPDLRVRLFQAIDGLSDKLRIVYLMHDVEGYTHEEIGQTLGIPAGTSKARLFDARAKLRTALAPFARDYSV
ncbi:MAG TPA: RNA polymerase sigma factor [Gemmatimonadaceae bacterium]|nr:RNA polymerase sigma factor [Gemmatimonadaceae bacterium]